jgi:CrcB protein
MLVFFGGGMGAVVRYLLSILIPRTYHSIPLCTLTANFLGCFIASVVFTFLVTKSEINSIYKTLLITGFCGGLSTLSALSLEVMVFIQNGDYLKACGYIFTSLLICVISVILGIILVKKYV